MFTGNKAATRRFVQVGLVGAMGVLVQTALLAVLVEAAHMSPVWANILAAETAIVCNFIINNLWTFKSQSAHILPVRFALFNLSVLGSVAIQTAVLWLGVHLVSPDWYLAYVAVGIVLGWACNYILYTTVVWKVPKTDSPALIP